MDAAASFPLRRSPEQQVVRQWSLDDGTAAVDAF